MQNLSKRIKNSLQVILIATVALLPRIIGLNLFLTADEPKSWFGRSIQFLDALARADFAATFDSPAPGVTTMWAGSLGLLLEYLRQGFPGSLTTFLANVPFDPLDPAILPLIRLPGVLLAALTAVLTYLWGRQVIGQAPALLAALLLALDPFLLALTRILGHDGLVTIFMWLSLLAFLRAQESNHFNRKFIIISGAMGGLAFLTKYPSLFLGAFIALMMFIFHWRWRQTWPKMLQSWAVDLALWSIAAGFIFVLLWPAMWVDPVGRVLAIFNDALRASGSPHQKGSFFFGHPVPDPGTSYYLIVTLFKTTPVLWLGWLLALIGLIVGWWRGQTQSSWYQSTLIALTFSLLFGLLVTVGGKKQDRYILPIFPTLITLAALGYSKIHLILKKNPLTSLSRFLALRGFATPDRWFQTLLIAALVIIQAVFVLPHHPYYFTFYNPLMGGGNNAARAIIIGWGEGLDQAAAWLNKQEASHALDVVAWYSTTFEPFFVGHAIYKIEEEKISRTPKPGLMANYVVLYVNQIQRELPTRGALQFFRAVPPVHIVTLNGTDYAWIYPSVNMKHVFSNEARLVGQAELLGFNLLNEQQQPLSNISADNVVITQLYWEWLGKSPHEPIGLNLVDFSGRVWGYAHPLGTQTRYPFEQWEDGMVARDDFALTLLPGTPPGDYYLKAWIDRPATSERVGDFPVLLEDTHLVVTRPPTPPALSDLDLSLSTQLDTIMVAGITLLGFSNSESITEAWSPGESHDLVLYWQATQSIDQNHPLTLALVDSNDTIRATWIDLPTSGHFPTEQWQAGDIIRDPWTLTLPPYVPPGDYRLTAQLSQEPPLDLLTVPIEGRPRLFAAPDPDLTLNATFGDSIKLLGLQTPAINQSTPELEIISGHPLTLALIWQANALIDTDYTVTVQLLDAHQTVYAQRDSPPLNGAAPTTSWATGEVLPDPITLDIPSEVGTGPHHLLLALYQVETGQRLTLSNGADHLTIPVELR